MNRLATALTAVALTGLLVGCSTPAEEAPAAEETTTTTPSEAPTTTATPTPVDLRFVSPTAASCSSVWIAGSVLPAAYEWCADDDGSPVAGVRIGSCEVVTFRNQMFAVPGRRISTVAGVIFQDQNYLHALTACKRKPFPVG